MLPLSYFERAGTAFFNSLAMIDADGRVLGNYRKTHIPQNPGYEEKFYFSPGDTGFKVWETAVGRIGTAICWDQWFPEAARAMALAGAEMLMYPTAIGSEPADPGYDSAGHWQMVMRGHAAANILPVLASNRIGTETSPEGVAVTFYGSSFIADQTGQMVATASRDREEVLVATSTSTRSRRCAGPGACSATAVPRPIAPWPRWTAWPDARAVSSEDSRQAQALLARAVERDVIARIGMAHHARGRVVPEHVRQAAGRVRRAIGHHHHAGMLAEAHADAAAMVQRDPGGAACRVQQRVQERPVRHGVGAILHRFGLAVGRGDRARIEMVAADDDRGLSSPEATISLNISPARCRSPRPIQQMRAGRPWKAIRSCAMSSQRCRWWFSGKSFFIAASVLWMSAGSPESAHQRNGPMPRQKSGRI